MRFFTPEQVHQSLSFGALADAIAVMLRSHPVAPLRHAHALSATDTLLLMPAWSDGETGALGVKLVTVMPGNRERNRATVNAIYVLLDRESGEPLAVIDGEALTLRRTAAASLLAARHLARRDAENVLIVGTGRLAPYMARAHCHERKVTRLRVWGRNGVGAQTLAQMLRDEQIARIGEGLGHEMKLISTGGGSDGNFTAAMGIPTVDAMGPRGGRAHSADEYLELESVGPNTRLICEVIKAAAENRLP